MARRKAQKQQLRGAQLRLSSPPPVHGRRHETIQTDNYLEELMNNPPQSDMCTQTDLFLDRPVSPFYVPAKTGADVETQIYPGDVSNNTPNSNHHKFVENTASITASILKTISLSYAKE